MSEDLTLYPRPWIGWLLLAGSAAFTLTGVWLIFERGGWASWAGAVFFGICWLVAAFTVLPGSTHLRLTREGFQVRALFKESFYPWIGVTGFWAGRIATRRTVLYDLAADDGSYLRDLGKQIAGAHGALPDTFGLKADQLADFLNDWRTWSIACSETSSGSGPPPDIDGYRH